MLPDKHWMLLLLLRHFRRVSVQPHRWQPTKLLCPWDSLGKNTRVGCHFLLQSIGWVFQYSIYIQENGIKFLVCCTSQQFE